jgi:toluene monooxygenase system protein D
MDDSVNRAALNNMAGPVFRGGDMAMVAVDAIKEDNPGKDIKIVDHGAYLRVEADGGLIVRRKTMEEILGRPYSMQELEICITGFSGKIDAQEDYMLWYFKSEI